MNDGYGSDKEVFTSTDLSPAEEHILAMLAAGHTAKSIAAATGVSIHSVNERLRDARRKTGVGSSRELARLIAARGSGQNIGDKQIGVAPDGARDEASTWARPWWARRSIGGPVVMIVLLLAGLLAAVQRLAPGGADAPPKVVSTRPAEGEHVAPGRIVMSVTFDHAMAPESYSFTTPDGAAAYPQCDGKPVRSADGRTYSMTCLVQSGRSYAVGFNGGSFRNFTSADTHRPAEPAVLRFFVR